MAEQRTAADGRPIGLPFRPKQTLGQNFLRDANIARKIVRALPPGDGPIFEIGAGLGALTAPMLATYPDRRLVAVEIDDRCVEFLTARFAGAPNLTILHGDVLDVPVQPYAEAGALTVVGNLPYHVTSPVLFRLFELRRLVGTAILMVQREVADRMTAAPGGRDRGVLSVFTQYHAAVRRLFTVAPPAFVPRPAVESAVVRLDFKQGAAPVDGCFQRVVKTAFQQRRKKLSNSLKPLLGGRTLPGLDRRPETLSVEEFLELAEQLKPCGNAADG
jgi:16S rRNA (adenine1518-N6/adenine1519-N6)-dimethyltransferase